MLASPALALALAALPELRIDPGIPPAAERLAAEAWGRAERALAEAGVAPPASPRPIRIGRAASLAPGAAAGSLPGLVALRPSLALTGGGARALRHEIAHQVLFAACPGASADRLFHEAFAIAASGEIAAWVEAEDGGYLPLARALETVGRARNLDAPEARRALARLLADAPAPGGRLPAALSRRLVRCEAGAHWDPIHPEDLADAEAPAADALVVLSRHSGEVLLSRGAATLPLPFGSTLKPFLLAGARRPPPALAPSRSRPGWACGEFRAPMDAATALLRSCNGWFLDWAAANPEVVRFGGWGPALLASGLSSLPSDASEAIGIRPSLRMSPLGLAGAYRLLAEARPDVVDLLSRNAREGTLAHLRASAALSGVAAKTGTVLDAAARPRLGWIAAIDRDVVVVMAKAGRAPRSFARELAEVVTAMRTAAQGAASVQVLGLVGDPSEVSAHCAGRGFSAARDGARPLPDGETKLLEAARAGPLVCAGGPWLVTIPGRAAARPYAGVFTRDPPPPLPSSGGPPPSSREERARRGSEIVFRTTRLLYAAGVVAAEDAAASGEARIALARVADANAAHSRHPGRPVCDTTHCQAFLGTTRPTREERSALESPLRSERWLAFSRGGQERWREERPGAAVRAALGADARALSFRAGRVSFTASAGDGVDRWEERRDLPCEALRRPLRLPSCPERASARGDELVFEGRGLGHGEGLDVEWAKRSGLPASAILSRAFPALRAAR